MTPTHTRNDGKVDVNLIADNGETALYHRIYKDRTMKWGACTSERFEREFSPC